MGIWLNHDDNKLQSIYKKIIEIMLDRHGLAAPSVSHYSGTFSFQSMLATTRPIAMKPDLKSLESVRAHEAFHGFQAMAFQSTRELFRSLQIISRRRLLTLGQIIKENIKITPGDTILDTGKKCDSSSVLKKPFKSLHSSISTLEKALEPVEGVTVFDLLEGSAAAIEILNHSNNYNSLTHISLMSSMDSLSGIYKNAWYLYRKRGGKSAAVFAHLCSTSLRYGSISPPNFDNLPSPQEVFEYLTRFSEYFDSYVTGENIEAPDYSTQKPLGVFNDPDFTPIKADIPEEEWEDYEPTESRDHHFPDKMFESEVEAALESYRQKRTPDQIRLQDNLFCITRAIVKVIDSAYIRVSPSVTEDQVSGEGRMIYDKVAHQVDALLPGLRIEEVSLIAIVQPDFQARLAHIFETEVGKLEIEPWHNSTEAISHKQLVEFYDLAQKIEAISIAEYASIADDNDTWFSLMPHCCEQHKNDTLTLKQVIECNNNDSIATMFKNFFGKEFSSLWSSQC